MVERKIAQWEKVIEAGEIPAETFHILVRFNHRTGYPHSVSCHFEDCADSWGPPATNIEKSPES